MTKTNLIESDEPIDQKPSAAPMSPKMRNYSSTLSNFKDGYLNKNKLVPVPPIPEEVYDWLRQLLTNDCDFEINKTLNYYVAQNVKGKLLVAITKAFHNVS